MQIDSALIWKETLTHTITRMKPEDIMFNEWATDKKANMA